LDTKERWTPSGARFSLPDPNWHPAPRVAVKLN